MKASVRLKYGPPEVLSVREIEIPTPKDNEVLVRVHAATVSRTDCGALLGKPYIVRVFTGLFKPKSAITGSDFAGQIEVTGKNVKSFKVGDKVMGFSGITSIGSHAQFMVIADTKAMLTMPDNLSYDQAAACMEAAFYSANIVNSLKPKSGQKALVNGATGAIGSSMIQFLKYYGLYVTAVCSGKNKELVKSLGPDKIIDYETEDFTKDEEKYDFVLDAVGKSTFSKCKSLLKKDGIYSSSDGLENLFLSLTTRIFGNKKVLFFIPKNLIENLNFIKELAVKGQFTPMIDRKYSIDKIAEAYKYVASGQKVGNVIITME